jgi:hypothetical protein
MSGNVETARLTPPNHFYTSTLLCYQKEAISRIKLPGIPAFYFIKNGCDPVRYDFTSRLSLSKRWQ